LAGEKSDYRTAIGLVRAQGYTERAATLLWRSHRRGDARATYALATWYLHGCLYEKNPKKAAVLLRKAHQKGVREASFDLAVSYERGAGVEKSAEKAFGLYLEAADGGDAHAMEAIVRCIYHGIGTARNRKLAHLIEDLAKGHTKFG